MQEFLNGSLKDYQPSFRFPELLFLSVVSYQKFLIWSGILAGFFPVPWTSFGILITNDLIFIQLVFNLGEYRRQATEAYKTHEFFRADNAEAMALRSRVALDALKDACDWIETGGEVAVILIFLLTKILSLFYFSNLNKLVNYHR